MIAGRDKGTAASVGNCISGSICAGKMLTPAPSAVNASAVVMRETSRVGLSSRPLLARASSICDLIRVPRRMAIRSHFWMRSHVSRDVFSKWPSLIPIADSELRISVSTFTSGVSAFSTLPMPNSASPAVTNGSRSSGATSEIDTDVGIVRSVSGQDAREQCGRNSRRHRNRNSTSLYLNQVPHVSGQSVGAGQYSFRDRYGVPAGGKVG